MKLHKGKELTWIYWSALCWSLHILPFYLSCLNSKKNCKLQNSRFTKPTKFAALPKQLIQQLHVFAHISSFHDSRKRSLHQTSFPRGTRLDRNQVLSTQRWSSCTEDIRLQLSQKCLQAIPGMRKKSCCLHNVYVYIYIYDVLCKYDHCISQQFWVVHNLRLKNWSFQAPPLDCFSQLMMQLLDEPLDVNHKWCWKRLDNPRNAGFHREIQHVPRVLSLSVRKSMLKTSTHQSIFARKYHCEAPSFHWTCVLNHGSHISLADNFVDQSVNRASLLSPQKSKCMYSISSIQVHLLKCSTTSGFHPFGYFRYHILVHPLL